MFLYTLGQTITLEYSDTLPLIRSNEKWSHVRDDGMGSVTYVLIKADVA